MSDTYFDSVEANVDGTKQSVPVRDSAAVHTDEIASEFESLAQSQNIGALDTTSKNLVGGINELKKYFSDDANIGEVGTWTPTLSAGLTVTSGTGTYYKIGRFVFCNVIIWINSSQATDDDLYITLPFNSANTRTYGTVGYINPFEDFDNLCVGIMNTDNKAYLIYAPGDDITNTNYIKGNQITTAIQFTICYIVQPGKVDNMAIRDRP